MPADLGVNIDHVATVRQARRVSYPDPTAAAAIAEMAGADQITCHIRMDRRHIQERDLEILIRTVQTRLNLELAATEEMLAIASAIRPHQVTLVPERAGEVTTEGGLDLSLQATRDAVTAAVGQLQDLGIRVATFVDPSPEQVAASHACGVRTVELNTAAYSEAVSDSQRESELGRIELSARAALDRDLFVAAGHGLHYHNIQSLTALGLIAEYNIGHAIVARAVFSGLAAAVRDMKALLD